MRGPLRPAYGSGNERQAKDEATEDSERRQAAAGGDMNRDAHIISVAEVQGKIQFKVQGSIKAEE